MMTVDELELRIVNRYLQVDIFNECRRVHDETMEAILSHFLQ